MSRQTSQRSTVADISMTAITTDRPNVFCDLMAYSARGGWSSVQIPPKPLTKTDLCIWIANARVGDAIQYHEGFLLRDLAEKSSRLSADERLRLKAMANQARKACELDLVHLFSHRRENGHFRYFAIRSSCATEPLDIPAPTGPAVSDTLIPISN